MTGRLRLLLALAWLVQACASPSSVGEPTSTTLPCHGFSGDTVRAASWSADGSLLGVITEGAEGLTQTLVFSWPAMALVNSAETDVYADDAVPLADDGSIYWTETDPMSSEESSTTLWRKAIGRDPDALGLVRDGRYLTLMWAGGALIAHEISADQGRLVELDLGDPGAEPEPLLDWNPRASDFWINRSGDWIVWTESDGPGEPQEVLVQGGRETWRHVLPGYGGRQPSLTPDHAAIVYQRSETARLTVMDLESGALLGELDEREFYGGEISSAGILAAPTAHGPWEPNELCVIDVQDR